MYATRDIPGKGKGLVATRHITKGTAILCEESLFVLPPPDDARDLYDVPENRQILRTFVDRLPRNHQKAFFALFNVFPDGVDAKYIGRLRTNGLRLNFVKDSASDGSVQYDSYSNEKDEAEKDLGIGVCYDASRINHD